MLIDFLSSVPHNIRHSWAPGNPGNENCHSRIPGNKSTRPGMETLVKDDARKMTKVTQGSPTARAVVAAPRSSDANQILKSLHWLKVPDRIVILVTYKLLQSSAPHYLRDLITIQSARSTRSSSLVTVFHPPVHSYLKITKRSFRHAAPHLWNKLPPSLRIPSTGSIPSFSDLHHGPVCDLSYGAFHSRLKTYLFFKSFPP